jgi:hypothetical protein
MPSKPKAETAPNLTAEERRFIAETNAATEAARKHVEKHGIPPQFLTKRWREKTGFPVGVLLDWEIASAEFWKRIQGRASW